MKFTTLILALLPISGLAILLDDTNNKDYNIRRRLSKSRTGKEDDYEEEEDTEESVNTFEIRLENDGEEEQGGKQGNDDINSLGYTTSSSTLCSSDLSSDPTLKSAEVEFFGQNLNGYQFVSYPDSFRFDRKPALQAFVFDAMNYDIEPNMIGVRAEVHGVNFWFRQGGIDFYDGFANVVDLPYGTGYGQARTTHTPDGNHCVSSSERINGGQCFYTAVLRGFSFEHPNRSTTRRVNHMKVEVDTYYSSDEDECRVRIEACLGDWNHDDTYEAWVYFALVYDFYVLETGEESGTISSSGNDWIDDTQNTNPYYPCSSGQQPVLTKFEFEKMDRNWGSATDMEIDVIGAGVYNSQRSSGVNAWATLVDSQDENDTIDWSIGYAIV